MWLAENRNNKVYVDWDDDDDKEDASDDEENYTFMIVGITIGGVALVCGAFIAIACWRSYRDNSELNKKK